jgi:hypothetical protein
MVRRFSCLENTRLTPAAFPVRVQYRPQPNMTEMRSIASRSDVMVVNFGLHYLKIAQDTFTDEMTALLTSLKTFASTPGKVGGSNSAHSRLHAGLVLRCLFEWREPSSDMILVCVADRRSSGARRRHNTI